MSGNCNQCEPVQYPMTTICPINSCSSPCPSPKPIKTEVYLRPDPLCPPSCPLPCPPKVMITTYPAISRPPSPPPPPKYCITCKKIPCQPPPPPLPPVSSPCRPIWLQCRRNC